jgi:citrate lyase beta subunit
LRSDAALVSSLCLIALGFGGADLPADLGCPDGVADAVLAQSHRTCSRTAMISAFDVRLFDIAAINSLCTPRPDQIATARRVVTAFGQAGGGACQVDERMVDMPILKCARSTVAVAARLTPIERWEY